MPYVKTIWNNNSAPAINADNLNKIEQGIADAATSANPAFTGNIQVNGTLQLVVGQSIEIVNSSGTVLYTIQVSDLGLIIMDK